MAKDLEVIIGLEVHVQMNTNTKMFCSCDNDAFGKKPNTTVCPICMGHPGALPVMNEDALKRAVRAAKALQCEIQKDHHMDRKNYFYPDLPPGYQISQYDYPLAKGGIVEFDKQIVSSFVSAQDDNDHDVSMTKCRLTRVHIENDAGKLVHEAGKSYCDFNRAGTPLMEIVTEPDLRSASDAVSFAQSLRRILIAVDSSEADMYKGMMRFDASISLRPKGEDKLYPRSEIKNLNSFKSLEKALVFEEKRLRELWESLKPQDKEVTVHWDDDKEEGRVLRVKESAADYRYFPEPDIPPFEFDEAFINSATEGQYKLPVKRKEEYQTAGLDEADIALLLDDPRLADYFDAIQAHTSDYKRTQSVVFTLLIGFLKAAAKELGNGPSADDVIKLLKFVDDGTISGNAAKDVLEKMVETGKPAADIIKEEGMQQISDESAIEEVVRKAIDANPKAVEDYKNGKERALAAIVGFVMKETKGQANPGVVNEVVKRMV